MTFSKTLFLGLAVFSLTACQTTSAGPSPNEMLLAGIDTSSTASSRQVLSANSPTCLQFYQNTAQFVRTPVRASAPRGPSFGQSLLKTIVLGSAASAVGFGVASAGIDSDIVEIIAVGAAAQTTYFVGDKVYDNAVGAGQRPAAVAGSPMAEITKAAAEIGCPAPDPASLATLG